MSTTDHLQQHQAHEQLHKPGQQKSTKKTDQYIHLPKASPFVDAFQLACTTSQSSEQATVSKWLHRDRITESNLCPLLL